MKSWRRVIRSQATLVRNVLRGWPVVYTGASGMTIDEDDIALAARLLAVAGAWDDPAPVDAFERQFAEWNGSHSAFAFASGRVALAAAIAALDLSAGGEVVVPAYTCVVVANAIRAAGLTPVFADIELETYGLDFHGVVCERLIADYLHEQRIGRFADPSFLARCAIFEPAVDRTRFHPASRKWRAMEDVSLKLSLQPSV